MAHAPQRSGVVEYTVHGPKIGLVIRGFFDSETPTCLIIRRSVHGPLRSEIINAGDELVSINGHAVSSNDNLRWDIGAACRILGIRRRPVSGKALDFTRDQLIAIHESAYRSGRDNKRGDSMLLKSLDYSGVPERYGDELLQVLFPVFNGRMSPPPSFLSCGQLIGNWRSLTREQQTNAIDRATPHLKSVHTQTDQSSAQPVTADVTLTSARRARRRQQDLAEPAGILEQMASSAVSSPSIYQRPSALQEPPPTRHKCGDDNDQRSLECVGINVETINKLKSEDKSDILAGFFKLASNALRFKKASRMSQNQGEWEYGAECFGFLLNMNGSNSSGYSWECRQDGEGKYSFHRPECRRNFLLGDLTTRDGRLSTDDNETCCKCWQHRHNFFRMCRGEVELCRQAQAGGNPLAGGRHDQNVYRSPTLVIPKIEGLSQRIEILSKRVQRRKTFHEWMKSTEQKMPNVDADYLFDPKELDRLWNQLLEKGEVSDDKIFEFLFEECKLVGARRKAQGNAKGHEYSPLMIQFAVMLRAKCSESTYDFF